MLQSIGIPGFILILIISLIIFGPSKLPEIGRAFGRMLSEFKKATQELVSGEGDEKAATAGNSTKKSDPVMEANGDKEQTASRLERSSTT